MSFCKDTFIQVLIIYMSISYVNPPLEKACLQEMF